jgi:hypothetical protein
MGGKPSQRWGRCSLRASRFVLLRRGGARFRALERRSKLEISAPSIFYGAENLRGYWEDRFLGQSRVMINGEYRLKLFDFNFNDIWRVRIDGVAFGDMGRVFGHIF